MSQRNSSKPVDETSTQYAVVSRPARGEIISAPWGHAVIRLDGDDYERCGFEVGESLQLFALRAGRTHDYSVGRVVLPRIVEVDHAYGSVGRAVWARRPST